MLLPSRSVRLHRRHRVSHERSCGVWRAHRCRLRHERRRRWREPARKRRRWWREPARPTSLRRRERWTLCLSMWLRRWCRRVVLCVESVSVFVHVCGIRREVLLPQLGGVLLLLLLLLLVRWVVHGRRRGCRRRLVLDRRGVVDRSSIRSRGLVVRRRLHHHEFDGASFGGGWWLVVVKASTSFKKKRRMSK